MDTAYLKYPKKSHRKVIKFPSEGVELAEFLGIEFGDGGIGNPWQVVISLNSILDRKYAEYIINLGLRLFAIKPALRKRPNQNTLVLVYSGMHLVDFLVKMGAVRGNKVLQQVDIPNWVRQNFEYERACVRGLMDTDGGCYFHKHRVNGLMYRNFGMCFTNKSLPIVQSMAKVLKSLGLKFSLVNYKTQIYVYCFEEIKKYFKLIGSNNPKNWKKFNYYLNQKTHRIRWDSGVV